MEAIKRLNTFIKNHADHATVLREICVAAAQLVPNANLISLWNFNDDQSAIHNLVTLDVATETFSQQTDLLRENFPVYFSAIVENELISASHARKHSMTRCFNEKYFEPNDIHSLLDFILHKNFQPIGMICCESKGKQVEWTRQDEDNLRMLAVLVSFYFQL